jgi:hypothetical protein
LFQFFFVQREGQYKKKGAIYHPGSVMSRTASAVKSKEAFNNYFFDMANDSEIQIDNDISPVSLLKNV